MPQIELEKSLKIDTSKFASRQWKNWTEPKIVEVEGLDVAYRREGQGETLVYLHGGAGTRQWGPIHQALAEQFDVIAPEHPGYGDTPRFEDQDSWTDFVLHYDAFFRKLNLTHFHLVGTSLGAWLAANLAVYFPERYASITLITPLGLHIDDEPFIDVFRFQPEDALDALFNGRAAAHEELLVQEGGTSDILQAFHEDGTSALLFWNPRYDYKLNRRLQRVKAPALVIAAEDDRMTGNLQPARYAALLPNSELKTLGNVSNSPTSHALVYENPQEVAALISAFIAKNRTSAPALSTAVKTAAEA